MTRWFPWLALGGVVAALAAVVPSSSWSLGGTSAAVEATDSSALADGLPAPIPFDSATTARYRDTGGKLATAVATDDTAAFRALHTAAGWDQTDDWWKVMLADQKKGFGKVVRAVGPLRGVIRTGRTGVGLPRDGAAILLQFEKPCGASMSYTLDDSGKIVRSSLWVMRELADANTAGAEVLWQAPKKGAKP